MSQENANKTPSEPSAGLPASGVNAADDSKARPPAGEHDSSTIVARQISRPSSPKHVVPLPTAVTGAPNKPALANEEDRPPPVSRRETYLGCTIDNRYKVEARLGEGGMGIVYKCRHKVIDKLVALKILRSDLASDQEVTDRFLIEAKAASSIANEHIIDISDFGQLPNGSAYFVMEFLEGVPLSGAVPEGTPMPVRRLADIAMQLSVGLAAAHEAGVVHRDLKPDNIFLVQRGGKNDFVKLLDFGIAKVNSGRTGKLTQAGSVFGTPHYMSPEQAAGAPVDHRGDIYALGVILYELSCGRLPFDADNFMGILTQHMYKAPAPIRTISPEAGEIPPGFEAIILKCLSKRPEQRYQNMDELREDLERLVANGVPAAVPEMMERSGGFHVPTDFFKQGVPMPAPVSATPTDLPKRRTNWALYAGIAAPIVIAGAIFFAQSTDSTAHTKTQTVAPAKTVTKAKTVKSPGAAHESTASEVPAIAVSGSTIEPEPAAVEVEALQTITLGVDPTDARVYVNDEDMGSNPVKLEIPNGEKLEIKVKRSGYRTRKVVVDGESDGKQITLKKRWVPTKKQLRAAKKAAKGKAPTQVKPKKKLGGGEIENPWED